MPLLLTAALVASAASLPTCSWTHPGADAYVGNLDAAVDRYTDIPQPVREALKARMARHQYDEMAAIRRDSITGKSRYAPELRQMHFGEGQVCGTVTRSRWSDSAVERGLVYCESGQCLIVPTVCRNVSRVTRLGPADASGAGKEPGQASADTGTKAPLVAANDDPATELQFDAPGAGPSFTDAVSAGTVSAGGGLLAGGGGALPAPGSGPGFGGGGNSVSAAGGGTPTAPSGPLNSSGEGPRDAPGPALPLAPPDYGIDRGGIGGLPGTPDAPTPPVPEPRTAVLALAGLLGLAAVVRRRRRR